jgi:enoyl-CoA hydratase
MARDILLTGRALDVNQAAAVGLVQRRAADAIVDALELAAEIAALAPLSVRGHKKMLNRVDAASRMSDDELRALAQLELAAFESADFEEGLAAFGEKRKPHFTGT